MEVNDNMSLFEKQNSTAQSKLIKKYCLLSGGLALGIMIFVLLSHQNSLFFGDATVLRMDLYHQYGPLYAELYDRITKGYSLVYSWTSGLGNSFLGNFFNYCCSPFAIIMLLFGHKNMPEAIAVMITLKAVFSSVSFTYYINKSTGNIRRYSAAFGLLYTFCGYFVAYSWNIMWLDAMVVFPLVILGIERIIDKKAPILYIATLTYTMITNYYMAYMVCLISVLYFLFYYFSNYRLTEKLNPNYGAELTAKQPDSAADNTAPAVNEAADEASLPFVDVNSPEVGEINDNAADYTEQLVTEPQPAEKKPKKKRAKKRRLRNSRFFITGVIFAFSSVLAGLISAFSLFPVAACLTSSSATSSSLPDELKTYFNLFDFVANHLPSVESTIRSSGSDVIPNVYCGLITVMLIPVFFLTDKIRGKEKLLTVVLLGTFYLSFNVNMLNYLWHGLHFPNDLPYRYSFAYSFILLVLAYKAIANIKEFSRKFFITTGIGLFAFVILLDKLTSKNVDNYTLVVTVIFTLAYVILAALVSSGRYSVKTLETMLIFVIVVEICAGTSSRFVMSQSKTAYTSDYDSYQEIKEKTEADDTDLFYRTELTKLRARMDPSWYGYNGVSAFSSMAYENTSALMKSLGLFGNKINSYTYYPQTPVFNSFFSLKYLYDNNDMISENDFYSSVETNENFDSYEYKYYLPIAFSVSSDIKSWDQTESSNPFMVQNQLIKSSVGIDNVFDDVAATDVTTTNIDTLTLSTVNNGVTFSTSKTNTSKSGNVKVTVDIAEEGQYYVYAGSTRLSSIKFTAGDDYTYNYVSSSIQPFILDVGKRVEGDSIEIVYTVDESYDTATLTFCAAKLNEDNFIEAYNKIKSNGTIELTDFDETSLEGTVNVKNDNAFLFTSIPYDKSWEVYVDGERLTYAAENSEDTENKIVAVGNGLIGFDIAKGEHTVSFKYVAKGLKSGIVASCIGAVLFAAVIVIYRKKRRKETSIPVELRSEVE